MLKTKSVAVKRSMIRPSPSCQSDRLGFTELPLEIYFNFQGVCISDFTHCTVESRTVFSSVAFKPILSRLVMEYFFHPTITLRT